MVTFGGFWRRVVAYLIDSIIMGLVTLVLGVMLGFSLAAVLGIGDFQADADPAAPLWFNLVSLVLTWIYSAAFESSARQATPGKMALGMIVTDLNGNRISFLRATGRYFAKFVSSLILLIGFIMVAFTERKQGLHDFMASTLVPRGTPNSVLSASASVFE